MFHIRMRTLALALGLLAASCSRTASEAPPPKPAPAEGAVPSKEELKKKLSPQQYYVCVEKGTERAFTGKYWNHKGTGTYACAVCGTELFTHKTKYDSGSGWPSFWAPVEKERIKEVEDRSLGMVRTEIVCKKCGSHLGHVFDDGPQPTGLRYCVNSASLEFAEEKKAEEPKK